jgi:uncharacterized protein
MTNSPHCFVVRCGAQRIERWRNGGGTTRTVAIDPPEADLATGFRWRLSIAEVGRDGPFSVLPGIDRSLWLLAGHGMELTCGSAVTSLRERFQRLDFPGETPFMARLIAGQSTDANVMTRRSDTAAVAAIEHMMAGEARPAGLGAPPQQVLLVLAGSLTVHAEGVDPFDLGTGDALRVDDGGELQLAAEGPCSVLGVGFWPARR